MEPSKRAVSEIPFNSSTSKSKSLVFEPKKGEVEWGGTLKSVSFNQEELRKVLVKFILIDELSFNFVEGQGFRIPSTGTKICDSISIHYFWRLFEIIR